MGFGNANKGLKLTGRCCDGLRRVTLRTHLIIFLDKKIDHIIGNNGLDELASVRDVSSEDISCSLVCGNQIGGLIVGSRRGFV